MKYIIVVVIVVVICFLVSPYFSAGGGFVSSSPDDQKCLSISSWMAHTEITIIRGDKERNIITYKSDAPELYLRDSARNTIRWSDDYSKVYAVYYDIIENQKVKMNFVYNFRDKTWTLKSKILAN
jgi:hypothetical protein